MVRLAHAKEDAMAEWLKKNALIYGKGKTDYRVVDKKDALCATMGHVTGFSGEFTTFINIIKFLS